MTVKGAPSSEIRFDEELAPEGPKAISLVMNDLGAELG